MIWQRCMNSRLVVNASRGRSVSHAISPALSCDRLRWYFAGSVCPMRCARGSIASAGNPKVASRTIAFLKLPPIGLKHQPESYLHLSGVAHRGRDGGYRAASDVRIRLPELRMIKEVERFASELHGQMLQRPEILE